MILGNETSGFDPSLRHAVQESQRYLSPDWNWGTYNSPIARYENVFFGDSHGSPLRRILSSVKDPVVIDLMAPSGTIADLFNNIPDQNKLGIAVSLQDWRSHTERTRDEGLNIIQIAGDLSKPSTWRGIEKALQGRKANLIMEEADQGLSNLPAHLKYYAYALKRIWDMLDPNNGEALLSFLRARTNIYVDKQAIVLDPLLEHGVEASIINYGVFHIRKKPSDPVEMPLYSLK